MNQGWTISNRRAVDAALDGFARAVGEIETTGIAQATVPVVDAARSKASSGGPQARRAAPGLRVVDDRTPRIEWSGSGSVVSGGGTITQLAGGVEYGGPSYFPNGGRRFPTPNVPSGRYLGPTVNSRTQDIVSAIQSNVVDAWNKAARRSR